MASEFPKPKPSLRGESTTVELPGLASIPATSDGTEDSDGTESTDGTEVMAHRSPMPTQPGDEMLEWARQESLMLESEVPRSGDGPRRSDGPRSWSEATVSQAPLSLANYQPSSRPPGIEGLTTGEHAALESHPFPTPLRPPENLGLLSLDQTVELLRVAQDRLSLGDFTGALAIAEKVLSVAPHNESALRVATECQRTLMAMYVSRLGPLQGVPRVAVTPNDMRWLSIDHRAGFMLSLIDGKTSYDNLLQLSGMPTFDTLRLLHQLLEDQVISHKA